MVALACFSILRHTGAMSAYGLFAADEISDSAIRGNLPVFDANPNDDESLWNLGSDF
jgi:hypothetical protein